MFLKFLADGAWHGACLALAELARRGLLLPERLEAVVPKIIDALKFDVQKGAHSVGSNVRDSACYVCWAFARAYSPDIMKPYVNTLASALLKVAVFDREVNCRRAAAAAFQENVGRQGNFPHGIDILTKADYFSLCNRNTAYLDIAPFVAKFEEYGIALIDELLTRKTVHWDKNVRELSAQSLALIVLNNVSYTMNTVIPQLVRCS